MSLNESDRLDCSWVWIRGIKVWRSTSLAPSSSLTRKLSSSPTMSTSSLAAGIYEIFTQNMDYAATILSGETSLRGEQESGLQASRRTLEKLPPWALTPSTVEPDVHKRDGLHTLQWWPRLLLGCKFYGDCKLTAVRVKLMLRQFHI